MEFNEGDEVIITGGQFIYHILSEGVLCKIIKKHPMLSNKYIVRGKHSIRGNMTTQTIKVEDIKLANKKKHKYYFKEYGTG
ncbi:MAG: hypothetical protein ACOC1O_02580 [bacterium]